MPSLVRRATEPDALTPRRAELAIEFASVTKAAGSDGKAVWRFIISSEDEDLMGDVVVQDGMKPVTSRIPAQVDHGGSIRDLIGWWTDIKTDGKRTFATLNLVEQGISRTADLVRAFLEAGVRMASSIGFVPKSWEYIRDEKNDRITGYRFTESLLIETSVVVVPANPHALQVARSLGYTPEQLQRAFSVSTAHSSPSAQSNALARGVLARAPVGAVTGPTVHERGTAMTLAERIQAAQKALNDLLDEQSAIVQRTSEEGLTAEIKSLAKDINDKIAEAQDDLATLKAMEATQAVSTVSSQRGLSLSSVATSGGAPATRSNNAPGSNVIDVEARNVNAPSVATRGNMRREAGVNVLVRSALAVFESHQMHEPVSEIVRRRWPGESDMLDIVRSFTGSVERAAQNPAMTNVPEWAGNLMRESWDALRELASEDSAVFRMGLVTRQFMNNGPINFPTVVANATGQNNMSGGFVKEGGAIRVGAKRMTSAKIHPFKMGVIGTWTSEMAEGSQVDFEAAVERWMRQDTAETIDTVVLDAAAAVADERPAGLRNGLAAGNTAASAGNAAANIRDDLRARVSAMITARVGGRPAWLMNPVRAIGIGTVVTPTGSLAFPEMSSRTLMGYPVFTSRHIPQDVVFLIDRDEVVLAGGTPRFVYSNQATIHEDAGMPLVDGVTGATVLPIATGAAGAGVLATPVRSLWQTDSEGVRMTMPISWAALQAGSVQVITAVGW